MTDPTIEARRRFRRTLMIFALAGPYVGLALSLLSMAIVGLAQGQAPAALGAGLLAVGAVSAVFAIPVGGLPGLLTGLVAAQLLRRNVETARFYALTGCTGALAALTIPLAFKQAYDMWIFVGLGAALICARIARGR